MQTNVSAVLFDFDGVIVDSEPVHCRAYLQTAAELGVPLTEQQYFRELIGFDDRGAISHLHRRAGKPVSESALADFMDRKTKIVMQLISRGHVRPLPGVTALVQRLSGRCGMGICSGALRHEIEAMLDAIGLRQVFPVIVSAEDVEVGKPDPRGYRLTAQRLSEKMRRVLAPEQCLVIEDAPAVALRARDSGFVVLGVETTFPAAKWPPGIPTVPSLDPLLVANRVPQLPLEN